MNKCQVPWSKVLAVLLLAITACGDQTPDEGSIEFGTSGQTIRRGNGGEPHTLDPLLADDEHGHNVLIDLYEGLVTMAADGSVLPGVASHWEITDDGRRYTFHLRENATWSNGDPVVASEFVTTFHRLVSPDTLSPYAELFVSIENFTEVANGSRPPGVLGVKALDSGTLQISLRYPVPFLPGLLAMPVASPDHEGSRGNPLRYHDPRHFVGNGAYLLDEWSVGQKIKLRRSSTYWGAQNTRIEFVEYLPISNPATELNMYRAGELDITQTIPPEAIGMIRADRNSELYIGTSLGLYYLAFDLSESPFDDQLLRAALTMAIDRETLTEILGRGEVGAFGVVPPGVANYESRQYEWRTLDDAARVERARELFRRAGYGPDQSLSFSLTYDVGDVHETVALAVTAMWRDAFGIDVELIKKEWKYFLATRDNRSDWDVMRFAWVGDYNDATTFLDIFRSGSPQNLPGYAAATYDSRLDQAAALSSLPDRARTLGEAEALLMENYPIAPLYFLVSKHLVQRSVSGYEVNVLDRHPTRFMTVNTP